MLNEVILESDVKGKLIKKTNKNKNFFIFTDLINTKQEEVNQQICGPTPSNPPPPPTPPSVIWELSPCGVEEGTSSSHHDKRVGVSDRWRDMEQRMLDIITNKLAPQSFQCVVCKKNCANVIRCSDCSSNAYYCLQHWEETHKQIFWHRPEIWKVCLSLSNLEIQRTAFSKYRCLIFLSF